MHSQTEPDDGRGARLRAALEWLRAAGLRRSETLPNLATVYPGPLHGGRWIGLRTVALCCIRGTASLTTSASRGTDFLPINGRETSDWRTRWARLEAAFDQQVVLPPVELIRVGGHYWVVDGHNRVALANEHGQLWIDADVTELDIPESEITEPVRGLDKPAANAA